MTTTEPDRMDGAVPAREFDIEHDPTESALVNAGYALLESDGDAVLDRTDLSLIVNELTAYRQAAGDRYTEARIVGRYRIGGEEYPLEIVFNRDLYDDPLEVAKQDFISLLNTEFTIDWVVEPQMWLREVIVTGWTRWN